MRSASHLDTEWLKAAAPGYLVAVALLDATIASSPLSLKSVGIPEPIQWIAAGLAVLVLVAAVVARLRGGLRPRAIITVPLVTGALLGCGFARIAAAEPYGVAALVLALLLVSGIVGLLPLVSATGGLLAGVVVARLLVSSLPTTVELTLQVESSYGGVRIDPMWLACDRAVLMGLLTVLLGALLITAESRRRPWRSMVQHYAGLERIVAARGRLGVGQAVTAVAALADPRWQLFGIGMREWDTIRITAVRTPGGQPEWLPVAGALRDAVIPTTDARNPLVRAARGAVPMAIGSCADLLHGMWRRLDAKHRQWAESQDVTGRVVPFGTGERGGVVFALGVEAEGVFERVADLAGVLTVVVGSAP